MKAPERIGDRLMRYVRSVEVDAHEIAPALDFSPVVMGLGFIQTPMAERAGDSARRPADESARGGRPADDAKRMSEGSRGDERSDSWYGDCGQPEERPYSGSDSDAR